ncbi:MAG: alanyl-tRNA editing protein [Deltaproteobacteria bacterium]|nr:alanyl-tRNA editing protein [Deltaproteobacteria bacterium]
MTERLYQQDSYLKTFESPISGLIEAAREPSQDEPAPQHGVVLERTAFFPRGGGVMGDEGTLRTRQGDEYRVLETLEWQGMVVHRLDRAPPAPGTMLTGVVDWERRYRLMRYHTATHVLCGVMFNDYGVRVTGNQLTPEKGRVDFSFPSFDRAILEEGFSRANSLVGEDREVMISFVPAAEALARPELFKLETGFRHHLETIRLVEIRDFDVQADGGCHVARLGEIGRLELTKCDNKGKSNRRVYFELGD